MSKDLVIVESPAKARTVGRFLGPKYEVVASMGHVRDLANTGPGGLGIEIIEENGEGELSFNPTYTSIIDPKTKKADSKKKKIVADIKKSASKANVIYLATDADREGEAISWHLLSAAKIDQSKAKRVVFHEITQSAVEEAFANTRELDLNLVDAYQARRMLDKIIGYKGSRILWKKVKSKISAGRVQSVALKLVVDLEEKIKNFEKVEYWEIEAEFGKIKSNRKDENFKAKLRTIEGKDKKPLIPNQNSADDILKDIEQVEYIVEKITIEEKTRKPYPPFITSTLQQDASRKLRLSPSQTMSIAQQLYEGIDIGSDGQVGLITYMRTDSTHLADIALDETAKYISGKYGSKYLPASPRRYAKTVKGAQEAHEAIRPTSIYRDPASMKPYLDNNQFNLYELIWKRMVASQMKNAIFDNTILDISTNGSNSGLKYGFQTVGSVMRFDGFRILYVEATDDNESDHKKDDLLPVFAEAEKINCYKVASQQKFTEPPARYTEASLIRALEKAGIGRPSTYATIVRTIQDRKYANKVSGRFEPTKLGNVVTMFLNQHFKKNIMDVKFTAKIEKELDEIVEGSVGYNPVLSSLYGPFRDDLLKAEEADDVKNLFFETTEIVCTECERFMLKRDGRNGQFLACSGFPECKNTMQLAEDGSTPLPKVPPVLSEYNCDKCTKPMVVKESKRGKFLGCSEFPKCRNIMQLDENGKLLPKAEPELSEHSCNKCSKPMVVKESKRGKFLGCSGFPKCRNIMQLDENGKLLPKAEPELSEHNCDKCSKPMVIKDSRRGKFLGCSGFPKCRNTKSLPDVA